jgi:hypothetical protein
MTRGAINPGGPVMAITIEYDSVRVANKLKVRRALALPLYGIALVLSYLSDGIANLAAWIADDDWP